MKIKLRQFEKQVKFRLFAINPQNQSCGRQKSERAGKHLFTINCKFLNSLFPLTNSLDSLYHKKKLIKKLQIGGELTKKFKIKYS
ncbi:MAG: hypothetical protein AB1410_07090 [Acidobacteriota bacterium]